MFKHGMLIVVVYAVQIMERNAEMEITITVLIRRYPRLRQYAATDPPEDDG